MVKDRDKWKGIAENLIRNNEEYFSKLPETTLETSGKDQPEAWTLKISELEAKLIRIRSELQCEREAAMSTSVVNLKTALDGMGE